MTHDRRTERYDRRGDIVFNVGKHFKRYGLDPKEYSLAQLFRIRDYVKGLMDLGIEDRFMSEIYRDILTKIERRGK